MTFEEWKALPIEEQIFTAEKFEAYYSGPEWQRVRQVERRQPRRYEYPVTG